MTIILVIFRALYQIITLVVRRHRKLRKKWVNAGGGNVTITLSLSNTTGINRTKADGSKAKAYTLSGTLANDGEKGIIIKNGKKTIK